MIVLGKRRSRLGGAKSRFFIGVIASIALLLGVINLFANIPISARQQTEDYKVYVNGEEITEGQELDGSEAITLAFDWSIRNDDGNDCYQYDLNLVGVKADSSEGELYYRGQLIGTYTLSQDGTFTINLNETGKSYSYIRGGVILDATLDVSSDKSEQDKAPLTIGFGDSVTDVVYRNPGMVVMGKTGSEITYDPELKKSYIDYTITIESQEIMKDIKISDVVDGHTELLGNSIVVKKDGSDITNSLSINSSKSGFSLNLPEVTNKKQKHVITITYRATLSVTDADLGSLTELKNSANLEYNDQYGKKQNITDIATTTVKKPQIKKNGELITGNDSEPIRKIVSYSGSPVYYYPIKYSFSISPNSFKSLFVNNPNSVIDIEDIFDAEETDLIRNNDLMYFTNGASPNFPTLWYAYTSNSDGALSSFFSNLNSVYSNTSISRTRDLYIGNKSAFSSEDELRESLANAAKLFGTTGTTPLIKGDNNITVSDFIYNESSGTYDYSFVIFVPSETPWSKIYKNTVTAEAFGAKMQDDAEVRVNIVSSGLLVKGADNLEAGYTDDLTNQHLFTYGKETLGKNDTKATVDYAVAFSLDSFRYYYRQNDKGAYEKTNVIIPNWQQEIGKIKHIKIVDTLNKLYSHPSGHPDPNYIQSLSRGNLLNGADIEQIKDSLYLEVYSDFSKYSTTMRADLAKAEHAFLDYMNTYGTVENQIRDDYDYDTLMELYSTYQARLSEYKTSSRFVGMMSYDDLVSSTAHNISIKDDGTITIDISTSGSIFKACDYYYAPTGKLYNIRKSCADINLLDFVGPSYYFVLRFSPSTIRDLNVNETVSYYNGAAVYFDDDTDVADDEISPIFVNSRLDVEKKGDEGDDKISLTKNANSVKFSDQEVNYSKTNETIGWNIGVNLSSAIAPENGKTKVIEIYDELPEGLSPEESYKFGENIIAYWRNLGISDKKFSEQELDSKFYTFRTEGRKVIITVNFSAELDSMFGKNTTKYLHFYFRTRIEDDLLVRTAGETTTIRNKASAIYNESGASIESPTTSVKITVPELIKKSAMDANNIELTGEPYEDGGVIKANYRIEINPLSLNITGENTLNVYDQMSSVMHLVANTVIARDADSGDIIETSYDVDENNQITFIVPDSQHLFLYYTVIFDVDPTEDPNWMRIENTQNGCRVDVGSEPTGARDAIDFSNYHVAFQVWVRIVGNDIKLPEAGSASDIIFAIFGLSIVLGGSICFVHYYKKDRIKGD